MPEFGWRLGGGPATPSNNAVIATTQSAAGGTQAAAQTAATDAAPPPPPPDYRWQGGEANPGGTQDQYGRQTGGRLVDRGYNYDANGRLLSPEEKAAAIEADRRRAEAGSIARSANRGGAAPTPGVDGIDYNEKTGEWEYLDTTTNKWTSSKSIADIYNTLFTDKQRAAHPLFYYENQASQQDQTAERDRLNRYHQAQTDAFASSPTTRYQPVRF